jgi:hypothetical protein
VENNNWPGKGFSRPVDIDGKRPDPGCVAALEYLFGRAAPDAPGADVGLFLFAVYLDTDLLKIRQPAAFGQIMGVADVVTRHRPFSANSTDSAHDIPPLSESESLI